MSGESTANSNQMPEAQARLVQHRMSVLEAEQQIRIISSYQEATVRLGQYLTESDCSEVSSDLRLIARVIAPTPNTPIEDAFASSTLCTWVTNRPSKEDAATVARKNLAVICDSCTLRRMCPISQSNDRAG